jgi:hypothetical protein
MDVSVQELEAAINYWREQRPARGHEFLLSPQVNALATVYALMIFRRQAAIDSNALDASAQQALNAWRQALDNSLQA